MNFTVWTRPPAILYREHARNRGRPRKFPRLKVKNDPPVPVRTVASYSPLFRREDWQTCHVKDGRKGPHVWRAKRIAVWMRGQDGLPGAPHHLLVAYNVLEPEKVKYFICNAPRNTSVAKLLLAALSRWKIERMFEDGKGELGMDHFEVRRFPSIRRHLMVSCVSYLFLAEFHEAHRGEKAGPDDLPDPHGDSLPGAGVGPGWTMFAEPRREDQPALAPHARPQCQGRTFASEATPGSTPFARVVRGGPSHMSMDAFVAL